MKVKTNELNGAALDWAVAKCEGYFDIGMASVHDGVADVFYFDAWTPSTDWAQGGPIIEREGIELLLHVDARQTGANCEILGFRWVAMTQRGPEWRGPTPLIAAMRCYVASKLGDEVEVPDELLQGESNGTT